MDAPQNDVIFFILLLKIRFTDRTSVSHDEMFSMFKLLNHINTFILIQI